MRKITTLMLAATTLSLSGCVGLGAVETVDKICKHRDSQLLALMVAETTALTIQDDIKREAALSAIRIARLALDRCPT